LITSSKNPGIKFAVSLNKGNVRKKTGMFLIEGMREIRLAIDAGYRFHTLYFCPDIAGKEILSGSGAAAYQAGTMDIVNALQGQAEIIETTASVFKRLVYRESSDGLLAVAFRDNLTLGDLNIGDVPLILVAESIEKPGNIGAILRTADAAGIDAVLVCDAQTDIYNPNVIRSSLGTVFTLPVVTCSSKEALNWLKEKSIKIFTTALTASIPHYEANFSGPAAIVAGAEATGVSSVWQENSDVNIIIPMFGKVDSMNVSVATSIVLYEALRQRKFDNLQNEQVVLSCRKLLYEVRTFFQQKIHRDN
jgi:RNA methyltransferase, TrmH family